MSRLGVVNSVPDTRQLAKPGALHMVPPDSLMEGDKPANIGRSACMFAKAVHCHESLRRLAALNLFQYWLRGELSVTAGLRVSTGLIVALVGPRDPRRRWPLPPADRITHQSSFALVSFPKTYACQSRRGILRVGTPQELHEACCMSGRRGADCQPARFRCRQRPKSGWNAACSRDTARRVGRQSVEQCPRRGMMPVYDAR